MESRFNEPLHDEVLGITNDFVCPSNCNSSLKYIEQNIDITKPRLKPLNSLNWSNPKRLKLYSWSFIHVIISFHWLLKRWLLFKLWHIFFSLLCDFYHSSVSSVPGGWAQWSRWDACSVTCGSGTQFRYRTCTNPPPSHGGAQCSGQSRQLYYCDRRPCPGKTDLKFCVLSLEIG